MVGEVGCEPAVCCNTFEVGAGRTTNHFVSIGQRALEV